MQNFSLAYDAASQAMLDFSEVLKGDDFEMEIHDAVSNIFDEYVIYYKQRPFIGFFINLPYENKLGNGTKQIDAYIKSVINNIKKLGI